MKDYGWRSIPIDNRIKAIKYFETMPDNTEEERRDRAILKYFLLDNLSASAICRREDPLVVCHSNRGIGAPLSVSSVLRIIYKHCPYLKVERKSQKNNKRVELIRKREKQPSRHYKRCAMCGETNNLEEHHMIPLVMGGTNDEENLIFLCCDCHQAVTQYQRRVCKCLNDSKGR